MYIITTEYVDEYINVFRHVSNIFLPMCDVRAQFIFNANFKEG